MGVSSSGRTNYDGKGSTSKPVSITKSSYDGKGSRGGSSYDGKGTLTSQSISAKPYVDAHEKKPDSKYVQMQKVLEAVEALEAAKAEAKNIVKKAEDNLRSQIKKLDPETRARFMALLGEDNGPGGEDR